MEYFGNVHFLGVGRIDGSRAAVIASHAYNTETDLNGVRTVLEQPNLSMKPSTHYSFQSGNLAWHLIAGEEEKTVAMV